MSFLELAKRHLKSHEQTAAMAWTTADYRETWEERAAIMEFDGGLTRSEANRRATDTVLSGIEWPSLPPVGLEGSELDQAWNNWWNRIEESLSCAN
jgi:hypothetical protein